MSADTPGLGIYVRFDRETWAALRERASASGFSPARTIADIVAQTVGTTRTAQRGQGTNHGTHHS